MSEKEPKRILVLHGTNGSGKMFRITKATAVKTVKKMIHLDQLQDGSFRIIYNPELIPDLTKLDCIKIIRED